MNSLRYLLIFITLALLNAIAAASEVTFVGSPGWSISNGQCTFLVSGKILNRSAAGQVSGPLRLSLWVTSAPQSTAGYRVAVCSLDALQGGFEYSNIKPSGACTIPVLTGKFYFTASLEEYTGAGWVITDYSNSHLEVLKNGTIVDPKKWKAPSGKIIAPRKSLETGDAISLTFQGSTGPSGSSAVYVTNGSKLKLNIKIQAGGKATVKGGSAPSGVSARYTYKRKKTVYAKKSYSTGSLFLNYSDDSKVTSKSSISLFFQKSGRGFHKTVGTVETFDTTSWGIFSIK